MHYAIDQSATNPAKYVFLFPVMTRSQILLKDCDLTNCLVSQYTNFLTIYKI